MVQPCATVVLMGDLNAVYAAQAGHTHQLKEHGVFDESVDLAREGAFPRGEVSRRLAEDEPCLDSEEVLVGVYIDDLGALAVVPWEKICKNSTTLSGVVAARADAAYSELRLPQSSSKAQDEVLEGKLWGARVDGRRGLVGVEPGKRLLLSLLSALACLRAVGGHMLAALLGHWLYVLQFRRAAFSILEAAYVEERARGLRPARRPLEEGTRSELLVASCLWPLMESDLRRELFEEVGATDASEERGGVCAAVALPAVRQVLCDLSKGEGSMCV